MNFFVKTNGIDCSTQAKYRHRRYFILGIDSEMTTVTVFRNVKNKLLMRVQSFRKDGETPPEMQVLSHSALNIFIKYLLQQIKPTV